jgi:hypothetical protein
VCTHMSLVLIELPSFESRSRLGSHPRTDPSDSPVARRFQCIDWTS